MSLRYSILPAAHSDVAVIGELLFESKRKLNINLLLWRNWPNETAQRSQYTKTIEDSLAIAEIYTFKAVEDETQQVIAFMALKRVRPTARRSQREAVQNNLNPTVLEAVDEAMYTIAKGSESIDHLGWLPMTLARGKLTVRQK